MVSHDIDLFLVKVIQRHYRSPVRANGKEVDAGRAWRGGVLCIRGIVHQSVVNDQIVAQVLTRSVPMHRDSRLTVVGQKIGHDNVSGVYASRKWREDAYARSLSVVPVMPRGVVVDGVVHEAVGTIVIE